ncbi:hypothetical protein, partial [Serratia marcescens]|uniref:hypothetical protein n=1 Tax=Serratia marcescens TaxID=615 RepID=UPI001BD39CD5
PGSVQPASTEGDSSINKGRGNSFMALLTRGRKRFSRRVAPSVANGGKIASSLRGFFGEERKGGAFSD